MNPLILCPSHMNFISTSCSYVSDITINFFGEKYMVNILDHYQPMYFQSVTLTLFQGSKLKILVSLERGDSENFVMLGRLAPFYSYFMDPEGIYMFSSMFSSLFYSMF